MSISVTTEEAAFSSRAVSSAWIAALIVAAVSNGGASEGTEASAVLSDTSQRSNVINVSFVVVDQVRDRGDEVFVIVDGCCQLVECIENELAHRPPNQRWQ